LIISCAPLRISYIGGGSDLPSYYQRFGGKVISSTIDKYCYILINSRYDDEIRIVYSSQEIVHHISEIHHDLVRESAKLTNMPDGGWELKTWADIPSANGSGLGSSSAIVVGLLNVFYTYLGKQVSNQQLAEEACHIEIDVLGHEIGKQDQWASAIGGTNCFIFNQDESVSVNKIDSYLHEENNLLLFHTNIPRKSEVLLKEQNGLLDNKLPLYSKLVNLCSSNLSLRDLINEDWNIKKQLSPSVCNEEINKMIAIALSSGAYSAKICGAGGGGFLLVYCEIENQKLLRKAMKDYKELPFRFEPFGTRIIFNYK
jgi:D-glycero-alpha-D-manno-heptose-7-phosphate kinase